MKSLIGDLRFRLIYVPSRLYKAAFISFHYSVQMYHFLGIEIIIRFFSDSFSNVMGWSFCYEDHALLDIFIRGSKYV